MNGLSPCSSPVTSESSLSARSSEDRNSWCQYTSQQYVERANTDDRSNGDQHVVTRRSPVALWVPELLDAILLHLLQRDVLRARGVCRKWNEAICMSPCLTKKLFVRSHHQYTVRFVEHPGLSSNATIRYRRRTGGLSTQQPLHILINPLFEEVVIDRNSQTL